MKGGVATWVLFILLANALMISGGGGADEASSGVYGRGTSQATTLIHNVYELQNMSLDLNGSYQLANDIDASATVNWINGAGFVPVGNETYPFTGTLDGKGYNITGLFINRSGTDYVGLFGYAGQNNSVKNLGVINIDVTGRDDVGGLMGYNDGGTVRNSYATGNVTGTDSEVGGLVGYNNQGMVNNSYATGNVTGDYDVGGLVGCIDTSIYIIAGMVNNSYATGNVNGTGCVGGLVGFIQWDSTVSNSYATGYVTGIGSVGGLVGSNDGTVSNCFWDNETSGQSSSSGGAGKTTAEMKTRSTFTNAGWDFNNLWSMIENETYPFFRWQVIKSPVADAGIDQTVDEGTVVTFDGRGSSDYFGIANYTWTFRDCGPRTIYGVGPTYEFNNPGIFNLMLKVTNVLGNWDYDTMTVTVNDITPPVSNAGPDQIVDEGTLVTFNGSASSDNVGIVNYTWTFTDGCPVSLYGAQPTYLFDNPGIFAVTLIVTDAAGNRGADTMTVTVKDITAPIADAGPDQTVDKKTSVTFDGNGSIDNVGIVNYTWTFTDGVPVTLYGARPTYKFDNPGIFLVTLNATDAAGNQGTDTMTVTVNDMTAPITDAGPDRTVDEGTLVTFNGNGSSDNIGIVNYTWTFDYGTQTVVLYGVSPSFTFIIPGVYHVIVNVSNAAGLWREDAMTLVVIDLTPPVANAGQDQRVLVGSTVVLNGSLSTANGIIGKYFWNFTYGGKAQSLEGSTVLFKFCKAGVYEIVLTVLDGAGNQGRDRVVITVEPKVKVDNGGLMGLLWMPVLLIAIAVAGLAGYMVMRKRNARKGGPSQSREEPGGTVTAKTAAAAGTPADEVETLQMDDGPQAGAGDPRLEDEAMAIASVAKAAALPEAVTPIPMHHVRCPNCRMRIPLYTDESGRIHCPNCGKTRIYLLKA